MDIRLLSLSLTAFATLALGPAAAAPLEKWMEVQASSVNTQSSFMLRVSVDRADRVYAVGEPMTVTINAERDCYLYLLYYGANDQVACLFPNQYHQDNFIKAGRDVTVPAPEASFTIKASPPCGKEMLQVVGTLKPAEMFKGVSLTKSVATTLSKGDLKDMVVELKKGQVQDWAEARIEITTVPNREGPGPQQQTAKRVGVCIGISKYQSERIPQLHASHKDAQRMAATLREKCQVSDVTVLTNSAATREAIEKALFHDLVSKTQPGDTVVIFFSGHGGRSSHVGESSGAAEAYDEYLVPWDGEVGQVDTMILDKVFARWLRELDGRRIGIILDNCYSGGCTKDIKLIPGVKGLGPTPQNLDKFNFFGKILKRAKSVGQSGTTLLAACEAGQLAWEMPTEEGSVLTTYLTRLLDEPGEPKLSLGALYQKLKKPVEDYVRQTFSAEQNPVFLDFSDDSIILKP